VGSITFWSALTTL